MNTRKQIATEITENTEVNLHILCALCVLCGLN